jgi:hypothetical protein
MYPTITTISIDLCRIIMQQKKNFVVAVLCDKSIFLIIIAVLWSYSSAKRSTYPTITPFYADNACMQLVMRERESERERERLVLHTEYRSTSFHLPLLIILLTTLPHGG